MPRRSAPWPRLLAQLLAVAACAPGSPRSAPASDATSRPQAPAQIDPADASRARSASLVPATWQYRTAAPLTGAPIVSAAGQIVMGTTEGYVHAIDFEGGLAWNYTTLGAVIGAPTADTRGRVYVTTRAARLYAIEPGGTSVWTHSAQVEITSPPAWNVRGYVVYAGSDNHLWAFSPRAGVIWRAELPARVSLQPVSLGENELAVATEGSGVWWLRGPRERRRLWQSQGEVLDLWGGQGGLFARGDAAVLQLELQSGKEHSWPGARAVLRRPGGWLRVSSRELIWSSEEGEVEARASLPADLAGQPVLAVEGWVFLPLDDGSVVTVPPGGQRVCPRAVFADAPVSGLVMVGGRLLAYSRSGELAAFSPGILTAGCSG